MRVIVPGGYYSYDSEGKKIWLDYQYYGTTLENIEKIKNLTRNMILYDSKNIKVLPIVSNGCITHSYQGTEADTDKIQITLKTPITNSLTELTPVDGVVTLETDGKVLVLPTDNAAILPSFNQSVLDPNRLTIAESPFGGLKGSGSPDYAPGTLFCQTDGVYLTDTNGQNSTKTLTAGKLKELSLLTVDTTAHTITEEFIVENTSVGTNVQTIADCDSLTDWMTSARSTIALDTTDKQFGTGSVCTTATATDYYSQKLVTLNLTSTDFIVLYIKGIAGRTAHVMLAGEDYTAYTRYDIITTGNWQQWVIPMRKPTQTSGGGADLANIRRVRVGVAIGVAGDKLYVDDIKICNATQAYIELQTPNNLSATSTIIQCWGGSAYAECRRDSLDGAYSNISSTPANMKLLDGTKFDDVYGSGLGRALFPKGISAETKAGSSGSITYSANKGTSKRIGFRFDLPPSDGGRTNFNKFRMKAVLSYTDTVGNVVPDLSGNNNTGTLVGGVTKLNDGGLQFDGSTGYVDCGNDELLRPTHITILAKIKLGVIGTGQQLIFGTHPSENVNRNYRLSIFNDRIYTEIWTTSTRYSYLGTNVPVGQYLYIGMVLDGSTFKTYYNGLVVDSKNTQGEAAISAGSNMYAGINLNATMCDISVYNTALTIDEIANYQNGILPTDGIILHYAPTPVNMGSTTHQFADSTNASYGLQNLSKPWIALYSPAASLIDFYLFTHRPQSLSFKRDETGTIYSLSLYPGAGSVYHGQIPFADLTLDTNSDSVPDCLEAAVNGSVTKFLENYTMVNPEDPDIAQRLSNDNYELMSNDNKYLYSEV